MVYSKPQTTWATEEPGQWFPPRVLNSLEQPNMEKQNYMYWAWLCCGGLLAFGGGCAWFSISTATLIFKQGPPLHCISRRAMPEWILKKGIPLFYLMHTTVSSSIENMFVLVSKSIISFVLHCGPAAILSFNFAPDCYGNCFQFNTVPFSLYYTLNFTELWHSPLKTHTFSGWSGDSDCVCYFKVHFSS